MLGRKCWGGSSLIVTRTVYARRHGRYTACMHGGKSPELDGTGPRDGSACDRDRRRGVEHHGFAGGSRNRPRLGRGAGGPSNIQAVGRGSGTPRTEHGRRPALRPPPRSRTARSRPLRSVWPGSTSMGRDVIRGWASSVDLARTVSVANDATLLFAAGTPEGWGLAVVAGTGSIAFALDRAGKDARAGGWGYLLGDEGSAFRLGLLGLRAACRAADGIGDADDTAPRVSCPTRDQGPARLHPGRLSRRVGQGHHRRPRPRRARTGRGRRCRRQGDLRKRDVGAGPHRGRRSHQSGLPRDGVPVALTGGLVLQS